jgi:hypothetical protein
MSMNKPQIGDVIPFGEYNWRVLDVQGDRALIITEDVLDEKRKYHEQFAEVTWETCDLRKYLNSEFLDKFDKDKIILTDNKNPDNLWYGTKGGNDTQDKIFLLSLEEVDYYFGNSGDYSSMKRKKYNNGKFLPDNNGYCFSNTHDSSRKATNGKGEACWWWLRSPGDDSNYVASVVGDGCVRVLGIYVFDNYYGGFRPALWLKL